MAASSLINALFLSVPQEIRQRLHASFEHIQHNYLADRFEPSELNAAKFCEAVFRLLEWETSGQKIFTTFDKPIRNFPQQVAQFEHATLAPDSVRFHIPRLMMFIYSIRNKRGVGHIPSDINPNSMDAMVVERSASWIMAELVRVYHEVDTETAQDIVSKLTERRIPIVWETFGKKRVLSPGLSYTDKTLVLLYHAHPNIITEVDLFTWVEHSNKTVFRRDVLKRCHGKKFIEYDPENKWATISPLGLKYVEDRDLVTPISQRLS